MARGIRFTRAEAALLKEILGFYVESCRRNEGKVKTRLKEAESIISKLELAEMPVKRGTYLAVNDAVAAFKEVLGQRLVAPGFQAVGVLSQMKNRIQALGLTRADCVSIAKTAGAQWQGPIRAESLVRQADVLMAGAQQTFGSHIAPPPRQSSPVELADDDI